MLDNVEALARDWLEAKRSEGKANRARLAIEKQITEALEVKTEGSQTHTLDNYKVTLTQPVSRKLDADAWELVKANCPTDMQPIKTVVSADATGCKWLLNNEPEIWTKIAAAFETKPGKIGVSVVEL